MISRRAMFVSLLALAPLAACDRSNSAPPATPDDPLEVSLIRDHVAHPTIDPRDGAAAPLTIISGAPNITEIVCALGLRESLVGRTSYCDWPPGIEAVPDLGALNETNVEVLRTLRADVYFIPGQSRALADRLAQLGRTCEALPDGRLDDLYEAIERVGRRTGRTHTAAALNESLRREIAAVIATFQALPKRRVLITIGPLSDPPIPPTVAGPGSFYDDLLRLGGHTNVAPPGAPPFAPLSLEAIVAASPDVVIELAPDGSARPDGDADALAAWQRFERLAAVAARRVYVFTGNRWFLLGPRLPLTCAEIYARLAREPARDDASAASGGAKP